jgi:hypothetical protein
MMIGIGTPSSQSKIPLPMIHPPFFVQGAHSGAMTGWRALTKDVGALRR